ncbi:hypothetical protein PRBEI_2001118300 [Prionailurus iriomotensis]
MLLWDSAHNCRKELGASSTVEWVLMKVFFFSKTYLNQFFFETDYTETKSCHQQKRL